MSKDPKKIAAEIQRLKQELADAERKEAEKKEKAIIRAAKRAGLTSLDWSASDFEKAFRRLKAEGTPAKTKDGAQDEPSSNGAGGSTYPADGVQ